MKSPTFIRILDNNGRSPAHILMKTPPPFHRSFTAVILCCMTLSLCGQTLDGNGQLSDVRSGARDATAAASGEEGGEEMIPPGLIKFIDADLQQVLDIYQELSGRTVLKSGTLPQIKVSMRTQSELSRIGALEAMDSALALNGIVMIPMGEAFVKAVPLRQASKEAAPVFEGSAEDLPHSGTYVVFPLRVRYVEPSHMAMALQPFANHPQAVLAMEHSKLLLLRDLSGNVRQMVEIASMIDRPSGSNIPARGRRGGWLFVVGGLLGLWLARVLLRSTWKETLIVWATGMIVGLVAMWLRNQGAGGVDAPIQPWSGEAAGLLFVVLVPWIYHLYRKWMGRGLTQGDRSAEATGVRGWLTGDNVIAAVAVAVLASQGLGYSFWSVLIIGWLVVAAYPLATTLKGRGGGMPKRRDEFERTLKMFEAGTLTPREFGHRVSAIFGKGGAKKQAKKD